MKKSALFILALVLLVSLCGCGTYSQSDLDAAYAEGREMGYARGYESGYYEAKNKLDYENFREELSSAQSNIDNALDSIDNWLSDSSTDKSTSNLVDEIKQSIEDFNTPELNGTTPMDEDNVISSSNGKKKSFDEYARELVQRVESNNSSSSTSKTSDKKQSFDEYAREWAARVNENSTQQSSSSNDKKQSFDEYAKEFMSVRNNLESVSQSLQRIEDALN